METDPSNSSPAPVATVSQRVASPEHSPAWRPFKGMIFFTAILAVVFARPLFRLVTFAPHAELYSHILLIPFISVYLLWPRRRELVPESKPDRRLAWLPLVAGVLVLGSYWLAVRNGWSPEKVDYLSAMTLSFLFFLLGGGFIFLGSNYLGKIAFPVGFLFFCVPFPEAARAEIESLLQHGSTAVAYVFFQASGMPVFLTGTDFQLPSFSLKVAPECSGIHSTLILIITSLLAAYLFLKTPWRRLVLVLSVIPLALLRNGFRVFVIGQLCVRIGPQMIDSPIHHRGGPVFFVLSLVPLFLLLRYLIKCELRKEQAMTARAKE
jgi:exosortase C (VPDSG-CTERM-specific)